jgi:small GTP-binding protein
MQKEFDYQKKICLLGDPAVGKTSLIRRFVEDAFDEDYVSTIGTNVLSKIVNLYFPETGETTSIKLLIWDIAGQKNISDIHATYYHGAEGALIVCDITRKETLDHLPDWIYQYRKITNNSAFVVLANKSDLNYKKAIDTKEPERIAKGYNTHYFLTSAKTGDGVENSFHTLCFSIIYENLDLPLSALSTKKVELYSKLEDRKKFMKE